MKGHDPGITLISKESKKGATFTKDVSIRFHEGSLHVSATAVNQQQDPKAAVQTYTWTGQDGAVSLQETVNSWIS